MYQASPYSHIATSNYHNATAAETIQQIINYGNQGLGYAQTGLNVATGQPITEGEFGDGAGSYQITHGYNRDESKIIGIPKPYFWGGIAFIAVAGLFIGSLYYKPKK